MDATYTSEQFATDFLHKIGNADPTAGAVEFVEVWIKHETAGPGGANFNPLNTTQVEPGSTNFNNLGGGLGVQNFTSYQQGVAANAQVLENGYYPSLLNALRTNNLSALGVYSGQESSAIQANLKTWGTGAFPVTGLLSANQTFTPFAASASSGNTPPATTASTNTSAPASAPSSAPVSFNAGTLILLGAVVVIFLVATGTMKSKQMTMQGGPA